MEHIAESRVFTTAGRHFLFLVASSALFEVDGDVADAVSRALRGDGELPPGTGPEVVSELASVGALRGGRDPLPHDSPPLDDRLATMVLILDRGCQLRCRYCYGRPHEHRGGPSAMSPERAVRAVDLLFDHRAQPGPLGITFFGGEPLLNLPALRAAADHARERAARCGANVRFAITTNGLAVTDEVVELLAELGARVTLSLDGDRATHDGIRRLPGGRSSHAAAETALQRLAPRCDVGVRATLTRLAPDPVPIAEHLWGLGAASVGLAPVDVADPELALGPAELDVLERGLFELSRRYLDEARRGRPRRLSNLEGLLRTLFRGTCRELPCGAGVRLLSCDADGALYTCHRLVGDEGHRMGHLDAGLDPGRPARIASMSLAARSGCHGCWARYLCGGGCHHARAVHGGTDEPMTSCPWLRRWLQRGLEVYATLVTRDSSRLREQIDDPTAACLVE